MRKNVPAGVAFDPEVRKKLDRLVDELAAYKVDRSEIVNAVLEEYLGSPAFVWNMVKKRRAGR